MKKLIIFVFGLCLLATACELETSKNGDLDGLWQLKTVDTLASGHSADMRQSQTWWAIQGKMLQMHDSVKAHYQPKIRRGEHVVLNTADTTHLKMVPGIGPYFARKIVEYGQRLGGYVSVDQLDEIENFPLDAKQFLVVEHPSPRRLNVNQLSLNDLKRHPYISFYQARAITDYRRLHGPLRSLDDLRLSKDFPSEAIERLKPYVEF